MCRGMDVDFLVPGVVRVTDVGLRVAPQQILCVREVDARDQERADQVIQRWLTSLLRPVPARLLALDGQRPVVGDSVRFGRVELVVREMEQERITRVGLKFLPGAQ